MMTDAEILKSRNVVLPVIEKTEERDDDGELPDYESYVKNISSLSRIKIQKSWKST